MATTSRLITAAEHNFEIYRGNTAATTITFPTTVPLTGATVQLMVKEQATDAAALVTFVNGSGITVVGQVVTVLSWASLRTGIFYYDLEITFPDGKVTTYLAGKLTVKQNIG